MNLPLDRLIRDLTLPTAYPHPVGAVRVVQTHISAVFLAGDRVYKVKKPVDFGFLDFSTLERREFFCREELRLNRRLSPGIYLEVTPVTLDGDRLRFGGTGPALEFAVVMARLDESRLLSTLLAQGKVRTEDMERVADLVAEFHSRAETSERITSIGGAAAVETNTEENFRQIAAYVGTTLSASTARALARYTRTFREVNSGLFSRREAEGWIRDGHGDLHTQHVCLANGVQVFDCIEFSERFRFADVLCDAAFLAMDLTRLGRADLAEAFTARYLERTAQTGVDGLYGFYACYRAVVRGKVEGFRSRDPSVPAEQARDAADSARRFFALAESFARSPRPPVLLVACGLMGCGKSSLGRTLGGDLDLQVISTDEVRKELVGLAPDQRRHVPFGTDIYGAPVTDRTYGEVNRRAGEHLRRGRSVYLDASHIDPARRRQAARTAQSAGARALVVYLEAGHDLLVSRLRGRADQVTATDGRAEILADQERAFVPPSTADGLPILSLDAAVGAETLALAVYRAVLSTT